MTKLLNALIVLLTAVLVFVIVYPQVQQNRPVTVRFACDSTTTCLPVLVAMDEGLFIKNKIVPKLIFYSDPEQALTDLFAGKLDVGVLPWTTVLKHAAAKPETLQVFMSEEFRQSLPVDAIVAMARSPIKAVADIRGRRFAYPPQLRDCVPIMLLNLGLRAQDMNLAEMPLSTMAAQLEAGSIDAAWLLEPAICPLDTTKFRVVQRAALPRLVTTPLPFPGAAIGFSPSFVKTYRQAPKRMKISLDAAMAMAETKVDKAKKILGKYLPGAAGYGEFCRLPELQRNVEINRPAVKALSDRMKLAGTPTADVLTTGSGGFFPDPQIFTK
jgi:NitT/TauT family transport system substrate-binding protein